MAQMQPQREPVRQPTPASGNQEKEPISNILYDLVTVMSNCGQAAQALNTYIDDCKKANDRVCIDLLERIREDEVRHGGRAKQVLDRLVKEGKF
jgi:bacterioferritin (cytochrome b1)